MTALRICKACTHESSLLEASSYCCGSRDIEAVWECDECGVRAPRKSKGWRRSEDHHLCRECDVTPEQQEVEARTRRVKTKQAGTPGGFE